MIDKADYMLFITRHLPTTSDQTLSQAKLAEDVHHRLHGRVVRYRERAEVEDSPQFEGGRAVAWQRGRFFHEVHNGVADHTILYFSCIF